MNAFLNPRNSASLANVIAVTAYSISLFQVNEQPKNTNEIFIPQTSFSLAEPIDVQINQLGNNIITMYQVIDVISDDKVPGLASIFIYINENLLAKMTPPSTNTITTLLKDNTTKKHIRYTIQIKPKHVISKSDAQMNITTIKQTKCK